MPPRLKPLDDHGLKHYKSKVWQDVVPFPCPHCDETVSSRTFEKHCSQKHALNPRRCCVWCQGQQQWPSQEKWKHVTHLVHCWEAFLPRRPAVASPSPRSPPPLAPLDPLTTTPRPFDLTPTYPKRRLFGHAFDSPPPLRAFDAVWPLPLDTLPLPFQDDSLNRAAACIRLYLDRGEEATEWFHAKVRVVAFPSFLEAMDRDAGRSRTLPFSCWCDGGKPREARHRQHRHFLVVSSPPGHFVPNVWKKIATPRELLPSSNFKCVHLKPIKDALHLINVLGYVSHRQSQCLFSGESRTERNNHFYLFDSLPRDYRLPLVLQWDGGLLELLHQAFRNLKRRDLVEALLERVGSQWQCRIRHIPGITLDTVLPVARDFRPCSHPTPHAVHLVGGRQLYFERDATLRDLSRDAWLQRQADLGNCFYHVVSQDYWTPRPYHQGLITEFRPLVERIQELEQEKAEWKRADERNREEIARLKRALEESKRENEELKRPKFQ